MRKMSIMPSAMNIGQHCIVSLSGRRSTETKQNLRFNVKSTKLHDMNVMIEIELSELVTKWRPAKFSPVQSGTNN